MRLIPSRINGSLERFLFIDHRFHVVVERHARHNPASHDQKELPIVQKRPCGSAVVSVHRFSGLQLQLGSEQLGSGLSVVILDLLSRGSE